jgi:hypothetical protein
MLIPNWRKVAKKAWSVRLLAAASVLTGCEAVLPFAGELLPRGTTAVITFVIVTSALLLRFVAQKELHDE